MAAQAVGHSRFVVNWIAQQLACEVAKVLMLLLACFGESRVRVFGARSACIERLA